MRIVLIPSFFVALLLAGCGTSLSSKVLAGFDDPSCGFIVTSGIQSTGTVCGHPFWLYVDPYGNQATLVQAGDYQAGSDLVYKRATAPDCYVFFKSNDPTRVNETVKMVSADITNTCTYTASWKGTTSP